MVPIPPIVRGTFHCERSCSSLEYHEANSGIRHHVSHICINTFRTNKVSLTLYCALFSKITILL
ncbi:hypothetical protein ZEAMMB73_Zm00001d016445 [Zea mays]|uniref:Uncharacterized protein n=1 Tax=Zea mays TaxID=4577 RepID=A0A1D6H7P7_MAIZE|nr:hypothetical protein ZEAMMB73_Zm00001d016445 [Zea mays]